MKKIIFIIFSLVISIFIAYTNLTYKINYDIKIAGLNRSIAGQAQPLTDKDIDFARNITFFVLKTTVIVTIISLALWYIYKIPKRKDIKQKPFKQVFFECNSISMLIFLIISAIILSIYYTSILPIIWLICATIVEIIQIIFTKTLIYIFKVEDEKRQDKLHKCNILGFVMSALIIIYVINERETVIRLINSNKSLIPYSVKKSI